MRRLVVVVGLLAVLVAGCGSAADEPSSTPVPSASRTPDSTYFQQTESDLLNKAAAPTMEAAGAATSPNNIRRCNRVTSYPAWRRCWHGLLDPLARGLTEVSTSFSALSAEQFPASCVSELEAAAKSYAGFSESVTALLAGYDSERPAARSKAANSYGSTLDRINENASKPFYRVTRACYSPEVLASLDASAAPSASPSP